MQGLNSNKPYILETILKPNKTYSCFGIKIRVEEEIDTLSGDANFELRIKNINLKELEFQSKGKVTKDTPIFCYNQESLQTTFAKLANDTVSIKTTISKDIINKAKQGLINPYLINLSFIPLKDNCEANNSPSQKIVLTSDDINKGFVSVNFKLPLRYLGEWEGIKSTRKAGQDDNYKKSEIDLRIASGNEQGIKIKWISQYDTIQVVRAGHSACKRACEAIMSQLGIKVENQILIVK